MDRKTINYYQQIVDGLEKIADSIVIAGRVLGKDEIFFEANGCITEELDFGTITTRIIRVKENRLSNEDCTHPLWYLYFDKVNVYKCVVCGKENNRELQYFENNVIDGRYDNSLSFEEIREDYIFETYLINTQPYYGAVRLVKTKYPNNTK